MPAAHWRPGGNYRLARLAMADVAPPNSDSRLIGGSLRGIAAEYPDALLMLVVAPSREVQESRLRGRGDPEEVIAKRLAKADSEANASRGLGAVEIVNDDLDRSVAEILALIEDKRRQLHHVRDTSAGGGTLKGPSRSDTNG